MFLRDFINRVNNNIQNLVKGMKVYGIADLVIRQTGSDYELLPCVNTGNGEFVYVGIDDDPVRLYHRILSISPGISSNKGTGDETNDIINTYKMAMIVYNDQLKSKLFPEDLFLFLQANIPSTEKEKPYKYIQIDIADVNMNSLSVFTQEYKGTSFKLPADKSLFQVNYTIKTTFSKSCFVKCPENC